MPGLREAGYVLHYFLLELLGLIFYESSGYCIHADWLVYIVDVDQLGWYDWGSASYTYLLYGLDEVVRKNSRSYVGLYPLLTRGHYFFRLRPDLLSLPQQWCEPDHHAASGVYSYKAYQYLLDLVDLDEVELRPFTRYEGFDWAPLNSTRALRRMQT